ncbi:CHAT domain-containing protein, partial [Myxococcota bacterium]|nr:CHAT domain-containing protein [Myxococcota bacterium]
MPTVVLQLIRSYSAAHRVVELPSFPVKYHLLVADRQVADFELDWPKLLKEVDSLEQAPSAEQARGLGRAMREALIKSGWESVEAALKTALQGGEATLVIRSHADELYALPWEAMPFGPNDAPLAEVENLTVLYHEPSVLTPLAPVEPPRAALLAWSAGGKTVPHARVAEALGPTRTLAEPSLDQLVEALRSGEHDALVLLAHGGPGKDGVVLSWAGGSLSVVTLVENLRKLSTRPALVVVLACRAGAEKAESLGFGGFGLELHRIGVAFVLTSRWNVSFEGAVALAAGLRGGDLRGGLPVGEVERLGIVTFGSGVSLAPARRGALDAYLTAMRTSFEALPWLSSQLGLARSLSEVCVSVDVCETARSHERRERLGGESVALDTVLGPNGGRWVMLGEPGSGKSTLLRRLALDLGAGGEWLPVLLHAGELDRG